MTKAKTEIKVPKVSKQLARQWAIDYAQLSPEQVAALDRHARSTIQFARRVATRLARPISK